MPKSVDLHGSAPDKHSTALLVIDLISDFDFPDGDRLARVAERLAKPVARLTHRAREHGVPVIYVNDNHGRWRSDHQELLRRSVRADSKGKRVVEALAPNERDYFILKPKHSGFFATPLMTLLQHLGTRKLILTGVTTEQCILFTAMDAYVREYELLVPSDAVGGLRLSAPALQHMKSILKATVMRTTSVRFAREPRGKRS
jgi:nicotinamidase-related amidase